MTDDGFTPTDFWRHFWRWAAVGVFCLALLAAAIVGAWQAGWIFSNANATRTNQQIQNGVSNQETLRAQVTDKIGVVQQITVQIADPQNKPERSALKAQRAAAAGLACAAAAQINGVPLHGQQASWVRANCSAGNVKPGSPYFVSGAAGA